MAYTNQGYYEKVKKEKEQADKSYENAMNYIDEDGGYDCNYDFITDVAYAFNDAYDDCLASRTSLEHLLKNQTLTKEQGKYEYNLRNINEKLTEIIDSYQELRSQYCRSAGGFDDIEERTLKNFNIESSIY